MMNTNDKSLSENLKHLEHFGYCKLEGVLDKNVCSQMAENLDQLVDAKDRSLVVDEQRTMLWNMHITHPELYLDKIHVPQVIEIMQNLLDKPMILSSFGAIRNCNSAEKSNVHIDSRTPQVDWKYTSSALVIFCLNEFTKETGSTFIWPQSHKSGVNPKEKFPVGAKLPGAIQLDGNIGDAIIFLGQTWHDVAPNFTNKKRWGLLAYYSRWWVKPTFDYTQINPDLFQKLTPQQKMLFGFNSRPPAYHNPTNRAVTVMKIDELPKNYEEALKS